MTYGAVAVAVAVAVVAAHGEAADIEMVACELDAAGAAGAAGTAQRVAGGSVNSKWRMHLDYSPPTECNFPKPRGTKHFPRKS